MRVALLTFLGTLLTFAVSLLLAIVGMLIVWKVRGTHANMAIAYRRIALPAAMFGGGVAFLFSLYTEIRHYWQSKTLTAIERIS
ncbi:MAG TPA: hypothetical protein VHW45_06685 [Candidatus Sulfotelmatobacter sp.]|nr:hypothetical protein [Candidatus Sulfotelmatobacter sp.]